MPTKYPNQKQVKIIKCPCDRHNIYAMINIDAMKYAAQHLKPAAFKLWAYLAKNQQFYELNLSSAAVLTEFGMKKDMYDNAVRELIENGFLVLNRKNTFYDFYEKPLAGVLPKKGKTSAEKQESTTRNNTISETDSGLDMPFQGNPSLPKNQQAASLDAAGTDVPAYDKSIPSISAANLCEQQRKHHFYVKYLGDNVVQFPSGQKFRVIDGEGSDKIIVNYQWKFLGDVRKAELDKDANLA